MPTSQDLYTSTFFAGQVDGSTRSASVVVPLVLSLVSVKSVIDVGCGVGPWAATFLAHGIDAWGVDGEYVDRSQLRIPGDRFVARDLTQQLEIGKTFDLAVCLEVAEHLPQSRARGLVADLTALAPSVLFSAAVPGPTGTGHINAQYLPYWIGLFAAQGYQGVDAIRPAIWGNPDVEWFYQQDIVIFAKAGHPILSKGYPKPQSLIHQELYDQVRNAKLTLGMLRDLPGALQRSIAYRTSRS
jgi:SAM-dependent methyltransferase